MGATVVSINVGKPAAVPYQGRELMTGINKVAATGPVYLGAEQLDGDGQADLKNHGGPDKAVCAYPFDHYPYWERELQRKLGCAAFGENATIAGLTETQACIGDIYRIGTAVVQISQPRYPCFKLGNKHGVPDLPEMVLDTGYSGFYFRVIEPGHLQAGDSVELIERPPLEVTVAYAIGIVHRGRGEAAGIRRLLAVDALSASWHEMLRKMLGKLAE